MCIGVRREGPGRTSRGRSGGESSTSKRASSGIGDKSQVVVLSPPHHRAKEGEKGVGERMATVNIYRETSSESRPQYYLRVSGGKKAQS